MKTIVGLVLVCFMAGCSSHEWKPNVYLDCDYVGQSFGGTTISCRPKQKNLISVRTIPKDTCPTVKDVYK